MIKSIFCDFFDIHLPDWDTLEECDYLNGDESVCIRCNKKIIQIDNNCTFWRSF